MKGDDRIPGHVRNVEAHEHDPVHRWWVGALLTTGFAAVLVIGFVQLPRDTATLPQVARYAMQIALPHWHITEPVNEIVYGTRAFDTFGETFLLMAAVVSVTMLAREREQREGFVGEHLAGEQEQARDDPRPRDTWEERLARRAEAEESEGGQSLPATPDAVPVGTREPEQAEAMTVVVRTAVRFAAPILAIAGCYLVAWGYSPGGGFPGGAVLTGVVVLLYAGFGRRRLARVLEPSLVEAIELGGAACIVLIELLGLVLSGSFTANWVHLAPAQTIRSGGVLQLFSAGELVEVSTGLTLAIFSLLAMRHDWTPDTAEPDGDGGST